MSLPAPLISVIIPAYNCAQYIAETLESVFTQTYPSYEVIVVNDGSTDKTRHVIKSYQERIQYIEQVNQGTAVARNRGLDASKGEFVVFLDADDVLLSEALADRLACLQSCPGLGMVNSGRRLIDARGAFIEDSEPWHDVPSLTLKTWLTWNTVLPSAMMFRRMWLVRTGGFDPSVGGPEDTDLVWRLSLMGCQADWVRKITVCYRIHDHNKSLRIEFIRSYLHVIEKFFTQPDLPKQIRHVERHVRYYSVLWEIGHVYCSDPAHTFTSYGQQSCDELAAYLRQTVAFAPFRHQEEVIFSWAAHFWQQGVQQGYTPEQLITILPYFRKAADVSQEQWRELQILLRAGLFVWYGESYISEYPWETEILRDVKGIVPWKVSDAIRKMIAVSPSGLPADHVIAAWNKLCEYGGFPASSRHEVTALMLTLAGRAALKHQWQKACGCFAYAVERSWHPVALRAWGRFLQSTVRYMLERKG